MEWKQSRKYLLTHSVSSVTELLDGFVPLLSLLALGMGERKDREE